MTKKTGRDKKPVAHEEVVPDVDSDDDLAVQDHNGAFVDEGEEEDEDGDDDEGEEYDLARAKT